MKIRGVLRVGRYSSTNEIWDLAPWCPACDREHSFRVHGDNAWSFNGDYDCPTFSPSMMWNRDQALKDQHQCHSYLHDGHWQYLSDCTHKLPGQTVPVPPYPPNRWIDGSPL